jgi:hypothetical protein
VTNLDVTSGAQAAAVEHWYRHRTQIENLFRDAKLGAAMRHLPSGHPEVNRAWMWAALLGANITGWLHQLTATPATGGKRAGHGVRDDQALIATLRHRLIRLPARLIRHAARSPCACHPVTTCSTKSSPASAHSPRRPDPAVSAPTRTGTTPPEATLGRRLSAPRTHPASKITHPRRKRRTA